MRSDRDAPALALAVAALAGTLSACSNTVAPVDVIASLDAIDIADAVDTPDSSDRTDRGPPPCDAAGPPPSMPYAISVPHALIEARRFGDELPVSTIPIRTAVFVEMMNDPAAQGETYEVTPFGSCVLVRHGFPPARRAGAVRAEFRGRGWDVELRGTATVPVYAYEWRFVSFDAGDVVRIFATGGEAPAFDYSVTIPPPVHVTAPRAAAFSPRMVIPADRDLEIRWRAECPGGTVVARLYGNHLDGIHAYDAECPFDARDGIGRVPTALLQRFRDTSTMHSLNIGTVVERLVPASPVPHRVRAIYWAFVALASVE